MIRFFSDTDCEMDYRLAEELGITEILMPYTICGKEHFYDNGKTFVQKDFYDLVRAKNMPITSALNMEDYKKYFEPAFANGDEVFYVSFSSELSGTFKYMDIAINELREKYPNLKFTRYDTKSISAGAGMLVVAAKRELDKGKSVADVCAFLDTIRDKMCIIVLPDDLMHLKRGGRLSSAQAFLGSVLQIRPIIKLNKLGKLEVVGKVTGKMKALMSSATEVGSSAKELDKYPIIVLDADAKADSDIVVKKIREMLPDADVKQVAIGPVIGTHCGPGTIGICYFGPERP